MGGHSWMIASAIRRSWRSWVVLALLLGIGSGIGLSLVAAGRRTDSAYPRFLAAAGAPDLVIDYSPASPAVSERLAAAVAALPGVAGVHDIAALSVFDLVEPNTFDLSFPSQFLAAADRRTAAVDRPAVLEGRLPDEEAPQEVLVNRRLAEERDLAVGDQVELAWIANSEIPKIEAGQPFEFEEVTFEVVGIGLLTDEVIADEIAGEPTMVGSFAFARDHLDGSAFHRLGVATAPGVTAASIVTEVEGAARSIVAAQDGFGASVQDRQAVSAAAQRAQRPLTTTLGLIGAFVVLASVVLAGQGSVRLMAQHGDDLPSLRAIGTTKGWRVAWLMAPTVPTAAMGAAVGTVVAVASSPLAPIGVVRDIEVDPGVSFDLLVMGVGLTIIVALSMARALVAAVALVHANPRKVRSDGPRWASILAILPAPWALGVRAATGSTGGRGRAATIAGAAVAVLAFTAVATFDAGRRQLLDEPGRSGWNWDVAIQWEGGYGIADVEALGADSAVADLAVAQYLPVPVDGRLVPTMVVHPVRGSIAPTITEGRAPTGMDEVALGAATMEASGVAVGERVLVEAEDGPVELLVTGVVVFPALGLNDTERPNLGTGALAERPYVEQSPGLATALVRLRPGVDRDETIARLRATYEESAADARVLTRARPADLASFDRLGAGPLAMAAVLAGTALAAVAHGLLVSVRRDRRDHAVLRAIGFDRRHIRQVIIGQAVASLALALVVGMPLGVALGRWSWRAMANSMGTATTVTVPGGLLATLALTLLGGAVAISFWPARRAGAGPTVGSSISR